MPAKPSARRHGMQRRRAWPLSGLPSRLSSRS
jgi:hypothetical protein